MSKIKLMTEVKSTAEVATTSLIESFAVAFKAAELRIFPRLLLNKPCHSLTAIETIKIVIVSQFTNIASGLKILDTELVKSSNPTIIITTETINPDMYSMRPWPKG